MSPKAIHTLYVSGLPNDALERELWNVFRGFRGFGGCKIGTSGGKVVGFVNFSSHEAAVEAREAANGIVFDHAHPSQTLRVEFAKQNMKERFSATFSPALEGTGTQYPISLSMTPTASASGGIASEVASLLGQNVRGTNPPCPTLFIGNVSDAATEDDLTEAFSGLPGFVRCRMGPQELTARRRVAFVDFRNTHFSTLAMSAMQGVHLPLDGSRAERKPIRIEFAKVRMVSKRSPFSLSSSTSGLFAPEQFEQ